MRKTNRQFVERMKPEKGKEWLLQQHLVLYKIITPYVKNKKVLDAGCGSGLGAWLWSQSGAQSVEGYDVSAKALKFAKKNYSSPKIKFEKLDFNQDKFSRKNYFDVACSIEVIEHLKNYQFYLRNIYKSLKQKGLLFLSTPDATNPHPRNKFHYHEFRAKELEVLLRSKGFKILRKETLAVNGFSKFSGKYFPNFLISLIKNLPFYPELVKILCQPKVKSVTTGEGTLVYLAQK